MSEAKSPQFEVHDQEALATARSILSATEVTKDVGTGRRRGGQTERGMAGGALHQFAGPRGTYQSHGARLAIF